MRVVDRSGGLRVGVYGGLLDSVNDGLLCDGPLRGVGTGGGLFGGGVGDGLRCSGADVELLQLQLSMDAWNIIVGGGIRGGLFGGGVDDSLCSVGVCAELRGVLLLLDGTRSKY